VDGVGRPLAGPRVELSGTPLYLLGAAGSAADLARSL